MWKRFLGPHARIVGIDLRPECKEFAEDQIEIRIGDQSDKAFLLDLCKEFGAPDVVLDDGSHIMSHIHASFSILYPQLPRNGVYLVEDLHTAYWPEYEGGLKRQESFIETCKGLIDELNADHSRGAFRRLNSPARPCPCTSTTASSFLRKDGTAPKAPHKSGKPPQKAALAASLSARQALSESPPPMLKNKVSTVYKLLRDGGIKNLYDYSWVRLQVLAKGRKRQVRLDGCIFSLAGITDDSIRVELFTNKYEARNADAVARYLKRDMPVIELGGSMGVVACVTNKLLTDPTAHVVVEANPLAIPQLELNRKLNGRANLK